MKLDAKETAQAIRSYPILLVDDDPNVLGELEDILRLDGFIVHKTEDPQWALDNLASLEVKLVISDQIMPGRMSGTELLQAVRAQQPEIVTMIFSAYTDSEHLIQALNDARTFYYLTKPADKIEILERVTQALQYYHWGLSERLRIDRMQTLLTQYEKMNILAGYMANMVHNFRNLVVPLIAPMEILQYEAHDLKAAPEVSKEQLEQYCAELDEMVHDSQKAVDEITGMVNSFLSVYRGDVARKQDLNLGELISDAIRLEKMRPQFKQIDVHWTPPADAYLISAPAGLMSSHLIELIKNAGDAILAAHPQGGGQLTVSLESSPDHHEQLRLSMEDNGCGMSPETLKNIFIPLFTTKGEQGTGLGLSAIYEQVQAMGGRIEVTSHLGRGSCFQITLPRIKAP